MSNAKWRKAFRILAAPDLGVSGYRWKLVESEHVASTGVVQESDLEEAHLRDGRFWPYFYREIEWLDVQTPNAGAAMAALARRGKFAVEPCEAGFRLFGYR